VQKQTLAEGTGAVVNTEKTNKDEVELPSSADFDKQNFNSL